MIRRSSVFNTMQRRQSAKEDSSVNKSQNQLSFSQKTFDSRSSALRSIETFIESSLYQFIMAFVTLYILFADDIKNLTTDASADLPFSVVCIVLMLVFLIELIVSSIVVKGYVLGFYFWLDLVSIITMLLDVHWFYAFFIQQVSGVEKKAKTITSIVKAGKSAKVAVRTIRILRIIRIIRLVRISKLYKAQEKLLLREEEKKLKKSQDKEANRRPSIQSTPSANLTEDLPQESKIGKMLSELTTKRVIVIILSMMIGIILFNATFYYEPNTSMNFGIQIFSTFTSINDPLLNLSFNVYVKEHLDTNAPLIFARVGYVNYTSDVYREVLLREEEKAVYSGDCENLIPRDVENSVCYAIFDMRNSNALSAILDIAKTIFISLVLAIGTYCFSKDTTELVLEPIELIVENIKQISKNPAQALLKAEKEEIKTLIVTEEQKQLQCCGNCPITNNSTKERNETLILMKTIIKISNLLTMSFGEAGSQIISKNMMKTSTGEINPSLPGKQVFAIFCVCTIENFHQFARQFEEDVIQFINAVAEVIHEVSSEHCGSVNRNNGESFLIVWKFDKAYTAYGDKLLNCEQVNTMTDLSLIAFIKMMKKLSTSSKLRKFQQRLNESHLNQMKVNVSFGFDLGWAIEGAVGSQTKIDVGYISPYAQRAYQLQRKASSYGSNVVMSDKYVEMLSFEAQKACRMIDIFTLSNSKDKEIALFTFDLDLTAIECCKEKSLSERLKIDKMSKPKSTLKIAKLRKKLKRKENLAAVNAVPIAKHFWLSFIKQEDYEIMRSKLTECFLSLYNKGFDEFFFGKWTIAREKFEALLELCKDDKPSVRLYRTMQLSNFIKPNNWTCKLTDEFNL